MGTIMRVWGAWTCRCLERCCAVADVCNHAVGRLLLCDYVCTGAAVGRNPLGEPATYRRTISAATRRMTGSRCCTEAEALAGWSYPYLKASVWGWGGIVWVAIMVREVFFFVCLARCATSTEGPLRVGSMWHGKTHTQGTRTHKHT